MTNPMKHLLPFSTDYTAWEDNEGIPTVIIWGKEGEGMGRVAMVYGEVDGESEQLAKDMAEFLTTAANAYYKRLEEFAEIEQTLHLVRPYLPDTTHALVLRDIDAIQAALGEQDV